MLSDGHFWEFRNPQSMGFPGSDGRDGSDDEGREKTYSRCDIEANAVQTDRIQ